MGYYYIFYNFGNNARKFLEIYLFYKYPGIISDEEKYKKFFREEIPVYIANRLTNEMSHLAGGLERGEQPIYFEEIRPKEEKAVSLLFKVQEQKVGKYVLPILLTYKDESEENTFSSTYFIPVTILSRDEVYILIEKIETKNGMKNIRLKIVNAGPSKIKFLTLNFQNAHPTTIYVGNLDSDDYSIEQISIPITENKIVFNFTYVNELDEKIAEERIISLEGFKEEKKEEIKESSCREYVYLFAILFLILIIIFYKLRK